MWDGDNPVPTVGVVLLLAVLVARTTVRQDSPVESTPALNVASRGSSLGAMPQINWKSAGYVDASRARRLEAQARSNGYADAEVNAAVNQLFASINPSLPENQYFTQFAKEKLSWIISEQKAGRLSLILLKNLANTNLDVENLMAAGQVEEGKAVIVIARPRFAGFLVEGGRSSPPFTQRQRNDFALGLVHEAVHLQNPNPSNPASLGERLDEELRAWREVNSNVVRQFRNLNQPMNPRMIEADDALRSCDDKLPCEPLRKILLPGEMRRH